MDRVRARKEIINEYARNLSRKIKIEKVILFGSAARGKLKKDSDLDIIILSDDLKAMDFLKRLEMLSHVQGMSENTASVPMDILGYTPAEFRQISRDSVVLAEAKKNGKVIWP